MFISKEILNSSFVQVLFIADYVSSKKIIALRKTSSRELKWHLEVTDSYCRQTSQLEITQQSRQ